uniref:Uncharacterized protein n=1 Tax=viral metagenome TaxID=1070528 RepID=A0A6C0BB65_9ZZZZ
MALMLLVSLSALKIQLWWRRQKSKSSDSDSDSMGWGSDSSYDERYL